jgi:hypothetical protein
VATGEAARLGIEERCRGEDPLQLPACHAVGLGAQTLSRGNDSSQVREQTGSSPS